MQTRARSLERVFLYNGITLQDPFPGQPLDMVKQVHRAQYAALVNAKVDGPELAGNQQIYTYRVKAGTNG
jgi:PRTRC genetic system protein C